MPNHEELLSFVLRAKNRRKIIFLLEKEAKLPAQLMRESGMYKGHTSRALKELAEKNLIFCKNPSDRAFRFYALSAKGKRILKAISELSKTI